jgi:hypothetical protein
MNRAKKEWVGKLTVYHATNRVAGLAIQVEKRMKPGKGGMFGGAIYFGRSREIAIHKAAFDGGPYAMIITAEVDFGYALVLDSPQKDLTSSGIKARGADSVKGRSSNGQEWEYVVFDPDKVKVIQCEWIPVPTRDTPDEVIVARTVAIVAAPVVATQILPLFLAACSVA